VPIVVAAIVILTVLVLVNLLLTGAIIRRLRTYEGVRTAEPAHPGLPAGAEVPSFTSHTVDGVEVTPASLAENTTLVGFFSTDCSACVTAVPAFLEAARDRSAAGLAVLAVVLAGRRSPAELLAALGEDQRVVLEDDQGPLVRAFSAGPTPWFFLVGRDGRIVANALDPVRCLAADNAESVTA
jgi:peroxiredoxin